MNLLTNKIIIELSHLEYEVLEVLKEPLEQLYVTLRRDIHQSINKYVDVLTYDSLRSISKEVSVKV